MIKIDLHTHSSGSADGSLSLEDYRTMIVSRTLDYVAVTDHDRIDFALKLKAELGEKIIIGQEITCLEGELVGLYLSQPIKPGQSALIAAKEISAQGGLVYVPHPFETVRKGLPRSVLDQMAELVDIVEVHNGRALFQNKGPLAMTWAKLNHKAVAASSDAHGRKGIGIVCTEIPQPPTIANLVSQLSNARLHTKSPPISSLLYPKLNRLRGKIRFKK